MKVLSATTDAQVGAHKVRRGARYVAGDYVAGALASGAPGILHIVADATVYSRPWRGEPLQGKRLLIYRPLGIGDEFIAARLALLAKTHYHAAEVGFATFEAHHPFWDGTPDLPFRLFPSLISWDAWTTADYHVCGEHWWESIATLDQPDIWRILELVCNIQIPAPDRIPFIPAVPPEILAKTRDTLAPFLRDRPLVLWQLAATSRIRSYPPDETRQAMRILLDKSNAVIIACGHPSQVNQYAIQESDRLSIYSAGIPGLLALLALAAERSANQAPSCLLCPDSVTGHIAAAHPDLPVISLWSAFHPNARVASYPNHRPIYNKIKCSPCWSHEQSGDPAHYHGCPLTSCNDYCAGLRTIAPDTITSAILSCLSPSPSVISACPAKPEGRSGVPLRESSSLSPSPVAAAAKAVDSPVAAALSDEVRAFPTRATKSDAKAVDSPVAAVSPGATEAALP